MAATNTPASWAATSLPTGLGINSAGLISGTCTAAGYFASSITASNDDGTSTAVAVAWLVTEGAIGAVAGSLAWAIDWDLADGKLSLAGVAGPEPAAEPPASGETAPLCSIKVGDVITVSLGLMQQGVLQEPPGITDIFATLQQAEADGASASIETLSTAVTVTGSDTTARHEIEIDLDNATVAAWLDDGELADGVQTYVPALLEFRLETAHARVSSLSAPVWLFRSLH